MQSIGYYIIKCIKFLKEVGDKMKVISKKKEISSLHASFGPVGQNRNTGWGCGC